MSTLSAVRIPLLNPNEVEASLIALEVTDHQPVKAGDVLASLETTKSAGELNAEMDGYVVGLRFQQGDVVRAGDILCYLAENLEDTPEPAAPARGLDTGQADLPAGLRITRPALALARQIGISLEQLPIGPLVTENLVRKAAGGQKAPAPADLSRPVFNSAALVVYGGGGHGKSLIDLVRVGGIYEIVGVVDDGLPAGEYILGVPLLGGSECLAELAARGVRQAVNAVGGIGNLAARLGVFDRLAQAGMVCPVMVHPRAYIEPSAHLEAGVQVFPQAYVGSSSQIGFGTIVNTGAILSHDCRLGAYVNISPGAILAGGVEVAERALVGMGVTVNLEVKIGAGARIGNGATVKSDVPVGGVVRAGTIWPEVF